MGRTDRGKEKVEELILDIAQRTRPANFVSSFVWWAIKDPDTRAESTQIVPNVHLRIYRGTHWRLMEFLRSDIDDCDAAPEVLKKYEEEITQLLAEL
jgi:hypothetical protein